MSRSEASRAGTRGSASAGRSGNAGAPGGNQYAGYRGPIGTSNPTSAAPGSYGLSGPETRAYDSAKTEYANRSFGKRVVDFLSPIKSIDPQINQPSSYAAGKYHHGFNPAGLAAGLMSPFGSGVITAPLAGSVYNGLGGHNVVMTGPGSGFSTSFPGGGPGYNSSTGFAGPPGAPGTPQGKMDQGGSPMAAFGNTPAASAPGGAPFGPQPTTPQNQMGAFFSPKIANHTLPQGYQSAFPNSLSPEDLALLYGQALA